MATDPPRESSSTTSPTPIGIVLVNDQVVLRAGLRMLIESQPSMRVIGEAGYGADAVALVAGRQPEIILVDPDMGGSNGLDFLSELMSVAPHSRLLILTGVHDSEAHRHAVRLGVMGLVMKTEAVAVLLKAIEKVHAGEMWIARLMMGQLLRDELPMPPNGEAAKIAAVTPREREVIALVAEGMKNKQIGGRLSISEITVRHHLTSIFAKLGIADRLELMLYAFRHHLVKPLA